MPKPLPDAALDQLWRLEMNSWRVNFVCNIGQPDPDEKLRPRAARLDFDEAAGVI